MLHKNNLSKSRILFKGEKVAAILKKPFINTLISGNSFILALAQHLWYDLEIQLPTSTLNLSNQKENKDTTDQFEPWADYLGDLVFSDQIKVHQDQVILISQVSDTYFEKISLQQFEKIQLKNAQTKNDQLFKYFGISITEVEAKLKICLINFGVGILNKDKSKPKLNISALFAGIYYRPGDLWRHYGIRKGQVPTLSQLIQFDVIILSGSYAFVNEQNQYVELLRSNLFQALDINLKTKVLGACFGHQLVCKNYGVSIQKGKLIIGKQDVVFQISENLHPNLAFLQELRKNQTFFTIYEQHCDYAIKIPENFICLAKSKTCDIQALVSKDGRIFTTQFHPEYTDPYTKFVIQKLAKYNNHQQKHVSQQIVYDQKHFNDTESIRRVIRRFIDEKNE